MPAAPDFESRYRVPAKRLRLAEHDTSETAGLDRRLAQALLAADVERMRALQRRLYAEQRQALLVVFQAMDAGGKDGTIAHVMSGLNPQGVRVTPFKPPTASELAHDWLWRCALALPERGQVGVFNRSHYEEVVTVRVHPEYLAAQGLDPAAARRAGFWNRRLEAIVAWERHLSASGIRVVKFFLNISRDEQRRRLITRATDPERQWKFAPSDILERAHWKAYQAAYEAAMRATSTGSAPWYVIPADHKWMARAVVGQIVVHHLEDMDPRFPEVGERAGRATAEALEELLAEG